MIQKYEIYYKLCQTASAKYDSFPVTQDKLSVGNTSAYLSQNASDCFVQQTKLNTNLSVNNKHGNYYVTGYNKNKPS